MNDLYSQIMNLRANARHIDDVACKHAYMEGHRDARHAAAELANAQTARVEALEDALREVAQSLAWLSFGECRGFSENLLTSNNALEKAQAALKETQ